MEADNKYLQLMGLVENETLKKIVSNSNNYEENEQWFFVDYSPASYSLETVFDLLLTGKEKKMEPEFFNIHLVEVYDQFGRMLSELPKGYKLVCKLKFLPAIPDKVNNLPTLTYWKSNANSIIIARHDELIINPLIQVPDNMYESA